MLSVESVSSTILSDFIKNNNVSEDFDKKLMLHYQMYQRGIREENPIMINIAKRLFSYTINEFYRI